MAALLIGDCRGAGPLATSWHSTSVAAIRSPDGVGLPIMRLDGACEIKPSFRPQSRTTCSRNYLDSFRPWLGSPTDALRSQLSGRLLMHDPLRKLWRIIGAARSAIRTHRRNGFSNRAAMEFSVAGPRRPEPAVAKAGVWFLVDHFDPLAGVLGERALTRGSEHVASKILLDERATDPDGTRSTTWRSTRSRPDVRASSADLRGRPRGELQIRRHTSALRRSAEAERTRAVSPQKLSPCVIGSAWPVTFKFSCIVPPLRRSMERNCSRLEHGHRTIGATRQEPCPRGA